MGIEELCREDFYQIELCAQMIYFAIQLLCMQTKAGNFLFWPIINVLPISENTVTAAHNWYFFNAIRVNLVSMLSSLPDIYHTSGNQSISRRIKAATFSIESVLNSCAYCAGWWRPQSTKYQQPAHWRNITGIQKPLLEHSKLLLSWFYILFSLV